MITKQKWEYGFGLRTIEGEVLEQELVSVWTNWVLEAGASTLSKTKIAFILIKYCPFKL